MLINLYKDILIRIMRWFETTNHFMAPKPIPVKIRANTPGTHQRTRKYRRFD